MNWCGSILNWILINGSSIINSKSNISNSIPMLDEMLIHSFTRVVMINWTKNKDSSFMVFHGMTSNVSFTSLKPFIGKILKPKSWSVEWSSLFCVSNPKGKMIYFRMKLYRKPISFQMKVFSVFDPCCQKYKEIIFQSMIQMHFNKPEKT